MRHSLSLFLLAGLGAALLLVPPMPRATGGGLALGAASLPCAAPGVLPWLGSLKGWPDSAMVMNWRAWVATSKGRALPGGC